MSFLEILYQMVLVTAATISASTPDRNEKPYRVVCYLGTWSNYRTGDGKFIIEHINPHICTHLVYGFGKFENNKLTSNDPGLDLKENWGLSAYERFNNLKTKNPQLSTLISIGKWDEGSVVYSNMAGNATARAIFVKSVVDFCVKYKFDGLDMNWKYPAHRGGVPEDKQNFVTLLKELKKAMKAEGLLLSVAVSGNKYYIERAYDVPQVSKYADFLNVMTYDFHGSWENVTAHPSALYKRFEDPTDDEIHNVNYGINYWINQGADKKKIVLGMALYGRSYKLSNPSINGVVAPAVGPGNAGPISKEAGLLAYNELCLKLKNEGWVYASQADDPYAYYKDQWVGYENRKSIERKGDYIVKNNLGGGMVFALEHDDFRGKCHEEYYPLLSTLYTKLNGPADGVYLPPDESTKTLKMISTNYPGELFRCNADGDDDSCSEPCSLSCVQWRK